MSSASKGLYAEALAALGEYGASVDHIRGWKSEAARQIGVHRSYITMLTSTVPASRRKVGLDVALRIVAWKASGFAAGVSSFDGTLSREPCPPGELSVMQSIESLDSQARARVLAWANAKFGGAR